MHAFTRSEIQELIHSGISVMIQVIHCPVTTFPESPSP
jgi:hypothetical protein